MSSVQDRVKRLRLTPIRQNFEPITAADCDRLERMLGASIPEECKTFLTRFGGCGFDGSAAVYSVEPPLPILLFYGGGPKPGQNLLRILEVYRDRMRDDWLPIAGDHF